MPGESRPSWNMNRLPALTGVWRPSSLQSSLQLLRTQVPRGPAVPPVCVKKKKWDQRAWSESRSPREEGAAPLLETHNQG